MKSISSSSGGGSETPVLSIVVPCYNEEDALPIFYDEARKVLGSMGLASHEFVFVDDGSSD
ncbi:MAG: glycosyltransferase, partial [Treponema sp.]|nr:glycosyltransferase [Treponema sp.]